MTQEMRERVARAACDAVNGDGAYDETGTLHREKVWHPVADAAIALIRADTLEEAAKVAESYDGPGMESVPDAIWGDAQATKDDIAYYIRALKDKP